MLDTLAKAPIQAAWVWLQSSLSGVVNAPGAFMKSFQAVMSLCATCVVTLAAGWFIAVKATEVIVKITPTAVEVTAKSKSA